MMRRRRAKKREKKKDKEKEKEKGIEEDAGEKESTMAGGAQSP